MLNTVVNQNVSAAVATETTVLQTTMSDAVARLERSNQELKEELKQSNEKNLSDAVARLERSNQEAVAALTKIIQTAIDQKSSVGP
jgi:hypothetical protein